jgi:dTDP-4-dehydrorhamnose reductase
MRNYLFLGYGPICRHVIRSIFQSHPNAQIHVITRNEYIGKNQELILLTPVEWLESRNEIVFDIVINSWRELGVKGDFSRLEILEKLARQPNSVLVNLSTVAVYGECKYPKNELSHLSPKNDYGINKLQLEQMIKTLNFFKVFNLRISNVYGDPAFSDFMNIAADSFLNRKVLYIANPDLIIRDFISIGDLREIIQLVMTNSQNSTFEGFTDINIGSGESFSLRTILETIQELTENGIIVQEIEAEEETILKSLIDTSKMIELYGKRIEQPLALIRKDFQRNIGRSSLYDPNLKNVK